MGNVFSFTNSKKIKKIRIIISFDLVTTILKLTKSYILIGNGTLKLLKSSWGNMGERIKTRLRLTYGMISESFIKSPAIINWSLIVNRSNKGAKRSKQVELYS